MSSNLLYETISILYVLYFYDLFSALKKEDDDDDKNDDFETSILWLL